MLKRLGVLIHSAEKYPSNLSSQYLRKEARIAKYLCSMQVFGLTVENLFFCKEEKMKDYLTSAQLEDYLDFFGEATDVVATIALYVTIAFFLFIAIYAVVIRNRDEIYLKGSRKLIAGLTIGYSVGVIATIGSLKILKDVWGGEINTNYWLIVALLVFAVLACIGCLVIKKYSQRAFKITAWACLAVGVAYSVVLLFVIKPEEDYVPLSSWQMYLFSAILVGVIVTLALLGGKKDTQYNAKSLTYAAVCIALSFALSYIKFFSLPQGGSVTFASLLPLALYSYMFGTRRGLIAGIVYGFLQFIQSPQFYEPMQVLLDYPIAFGAIGVAGIGRKFTFMKNDVIAQFATGTIIAVVLRYFAHVISGYYVFSSWAMEGYTALSWAFVYNLFTIVDLVIVLVMGVLVLLSRQVRWMVLTADSAPELQTANN